MMFSRYCQYAYQYNKANTEELKENLRSRHRKAVERTRFNCRSAMEQL
jgi:hypothetical protein